MIPSIPQGTVLRQRYSIQQILGQGGFGRTYLAVDLERFKEPCVLKELVLPYQNRASWDKAKVLFQREASTLYQLQHPQIPRFWALFEERRRLFLVQDFVNGKTYRRLLRSRLRRGRTFSEIEVRRFLCNLLPVLSYLHDRHIIHRDISPENIMLRTRTRTAGATSPHSRLNQTEAGNALPILIDFGAVKEVARYLRSTATRVGKPGYAPPEQMHAGKVYPHSDLYALAVTCLVLLTGKEPQELLDSQTLIWQWQTYVHLSDRVAAILEKMLAWKPSDRYQNASDVLADLNPSPLQQPPNQPSLISTGGERLAREPATAIVPPTYLNDATTSPSREASPSRFATLQDKNYWIGIVMGTGITLLLGLGLAVGMLWRPWTNNSLQIPEVWVSGAKLPLSEASQLIESHRGESLPNPNLFSSGNSSIGQPQIIEFATEEISSVQQGDLQEYTLQPYILNAFQGQIATVTLTGSSVVMNLLRSNQQGIDAAAYHTRSWTGQFPADDRYLIQVLGTGSYSLEVAMTPRSRPARTSTRRVKFARGTTGTTVTGEISADLLGRYLLNAKQGQIAIVKILQGTVNLSIISPTGERIGSSTAVSRHWQGRLPVDGDYIVEVSSSQSGAFAISFEIF